MGEAINLKDLEKKAWRSTFEDGLIDIYLGVMFFGVGTGSAFEVIFGEFYNYIFMFLMVGLGIIILALGKKYITIPRVGFVKFGKQRKVRKAKSVLVLLINFVFLLTLWVVMGVSPGSLKLEPPLGGLIVGLFMIIPLWAVAYFIQFKRLYFHAVLIGLTPFVTDVLEFFTNNVLSIILSFGILDSIIIATGVVFLVRFLKKYPIPKEEVG